MSFTSNIVQLNYDSLLAQYERVIAYLFETSDSFSVVADLKKPYLEIPPNIRQDRFAEQLKDYALKQITDIHEWPEGIECHGRHKVLLVFRACKRAMKLICEQGNLLSAPLNGLPEDICFLRKGKAWFSTITHEKMAFVSLETPKDVEFFCSYKK